MVEIQHKLYWINVIWIQQFATCAKSALKPMDTVHKWNVLKVIMIMMEVMLFSVKFNQKSEK